MGIKNRLKHIFGNDTNRIDKVEMDYFPEVLRFQKIIQTYMTSNSTPVFFLDTKTIKERLDNLDVSLKKHFSQSCVAYSFKTNYEVAKTGFLKEMGIGAEVVSNMELDLALSLGYSGENIVFNGPYKKTEDMARALHTGVIVNLDTWTQIKQMCWLVKDLKGSFKAGIRIKSKLSGIGDSRFGFDMGGEAIQAISQLVGTGHVVVNGLHRHLGTDQYDPTIYRQSCQQINTFVRSFDERTRSNLEYIDVGGGFPAHGLPPFHLKHQNLTLHSIEEYMSAVATGLGKELLSKMTIIFEPGRYLVDDAGILMTRILDVNNQDDLQIVLIDSAITMLPLKYYRPQIVRVYDLDFQQKKKTSRASIVYGATCREDDVLYEGELSECEVGDYLLFYSVGAYNQSMSSPFILSSAYTYLA